MELCDLVICASIVMGALPGLGKVGDELQSLGGGHVLGHIVRIGEQVTLEVKGQGVKGAVPADAGGGGAECIPVLVSEDFVGDLELGAAAAGGHGDPQA